MELWTADHLAYLQEGWTEVRRRSQQRAEEALAATIAGPLVQGACQLRQAKKTEACLIVQPSTVNGTELGAQEWRNALFLWYDLDPLDIPKYCDG